MELETRRRLTHTKQTHTRIKVKPATCVSACLHNV